MKIEVISIKDRPDGGADLELDFDDEAVEFIRSAMGAEEFTEAIAQEYVLEALEYYLKKTERETVTP